MNLFCFLAFSVFFIQVHAQNCATVVRPYLSDSLQKEFEKKLTVAEESYEKDTTDANALIWYGRRLAYLGNYEQAVEIFTKGIQLNPTDPRLYRHRGHRYITLRCFDKAIADLKKAAGLIKNQPDEIEEDGLPNAKNIPTSTLQSNIWYHLGLAYYLKADYKKARQAYEEGLKVSKSPDMYIATANWLYITLLKLQKKKEAAKLLSSVDPNVELLESGDYLKILMLYKSETDFAKPAKEIQNNNSLSSATYGYGLGNYLLLTGTKEDAKKIFNKVVSGNQWASFGFIAAEMELRRMQPGQ